MNQGNNHDVNLVSEKQTIVLAKTMPCRLKWTSTVGGLAARLGNNDPYVILLLPHPSTLTLIRVISEIFVLVQKA